MLFLLLLFLFIYIEFIWVTLFTKWYRFQVYNSINHHLHTTSCTHFPQAKSLFVRISTHLPTSTEPTTPFPSVNQYTVFSVYMLCVYAVCLIPSLSFIQSPNPLSSETCQSVTWIHASVSILFASLFCSLD